jgi:phage/plasmid-like protein (TIGR03299 family)
MENGKMAHEIMEHDRGVVWGSTWHGLSQYKTQETPVTREQAIEVLDFPIEKVPLFRFVEASEEEKFAQFPKEDGYDEVPGTYALVRPDKDVVLVPHVGARFQLIDNKDLFDVVDESLLKNNPGLEIESVGTLRNGATSFVNVKVQEWAVKGDQSPNINRLMYYNPLGEGSYKICAHNIRVVCNNTLKMATKEGKANDTLSNVRHTLTADGRITAALLNLAETHAALKDWKEFMGFLTTQEVRQPEMKRFLEQWAPLPEETDSRSYTIAENKQLRLENKFWSADDAMRDVQYTKYGLLQAVTWTLDHVPESSSKDQASVAWDGIVGDRAKQKLKAVKLIGAL